MHLCLFGKLCGFKIIGNLEGTMEMLFVFISGGLQFVGENYGNLMQLERNFEMWKVTEK